MKVQTLNVHHLIEQWLGFILESISGPKKVVEALFIYPLIIALY